MTESDLTKQQAQGRDPGPIDEDAVNKADGLEAPPEVGEHHREMDKIGANAKGEGRIP
ncbi:MAG TPA: hypothetical protein VF519_04765 [Mycobacteriales bacterium]|jgi:hypothetical protein